MVIAVHVGQHGICTNIRIGGGGERAVVQEQLLGDHDV
jgi:hypothetical protein